MWTLVLLYFRLIPILFLLFPSHVTLKSPLRQVWVPGQTEAVACELHKPQFSLKHRDLFDCRSEHSKLRECLELGKPLLKKTQTKKPQPCRKLLYQQCGEFFWFCGSFLVSPQFAWFQHSPVTLLHSFKVSGWEHWCGSMLLFVAGWAVQSLLGSWCSCSKSSSTFCII